MENTSITEDSLAEATGPATLARVMEDVNEQVATGHVGRFRPMATGFEPLDGILTGGLRPGDLLVVGGPFGVGKTILGLQIARNVVACSEDHAALYVCFEHDRAHLMMRLICLECTELGCTEPLTLRGLADIAARANGRAGLISMLRRMGNYAQFLDAIDSYAERLVLAKASGSSSTLDQIRLWAEQ